MKLLLLVAFVPLLAAVGANIIPSIFSSLLSFRPLSIINPSTIFGRQSYVPAPSYGQSGKLISKPDIIAEEAQLSPGQYVPAPSYGESDISNSIAHEGHDDESSDAHEAAGGHSHFGYGHDDGPETWAENYPFCAGQRQSPIDLRLDSLETIKHKTPLKHISFWTQPDTMVVTNNGHSIEISGKWPKGKTPSITGGPLGHNKYELAQMHVHWGLDDSVGSEHTVNGRKFPMEMHVVFWNLNYGTFDNAKDKENGLAVLGYLFNLQENENAMFQKILDYTEDIEGSESATADMEPFPINILNLDTKDYISYSGSLTTPPCFESVQWVVKMKPLFISKEQMETVRTTVKDHENKDFPNYRPVQPLNGRPVYYCGKQY